MAGVGERKNKLWDSNRIGALLTDLFFYFFVWVQLWKSCNIMMKGGGGGLEGQKRRGDGLIISSVRGKGQVEIIALWPPSIKSGVRNFLPKKEKSEKNKTNTPQNSVCMLASFIGAIPPGSPFLSPFFSSVNFFFRKVKINSSLLFWVPLKLPPYHSRSESFSSKKEKKDERLKKDSQR